MTNKRTFTSIRKKMIIIFLITTLLTSLTSVFILRTSKNLIDKMDVMFSDNVELEEFLTIMDSVDYNLTNYLITDDSDSILNYHKEKDNFKKYAEAMFKNYRGIYKENELIYKDILYMVDTYLEETDAAVEARRINDADEYIDRYGEANKISGYIQKYVDRLNLSNLNVNTKKYSGMSEDLNKLLFMNMTLIISVIVLNLFIIVYYSYNLTQPIVKLAESAKEISGGNFDAADVEVYTKDELTIMANAFNGMKKSIKDHILEIHDIADMESELLEQQIDNLKMKSLLDESELKALQMQINPHFLFNTLNTGMQLALIEGADRTSEFLDDTAKIFRYNVNSIDKSVKIKDEIEMVKSYCNMFKVRFGESVKFEYSIDESLLEINVPPLIIQPFIENATIHGIGEKENGGIISISIVKESGDALIKIKDNGAGMTEMTRKILIESNEVSKSSDTSNGIGVYNVVHRLRLFYKIEDVIDIETEMGRGTTFILKIPMYRNDETRNFYNLDLLSK